MQTGETVPDRPPGGIPSNGLLPAVIAISGHPLPGTTTNVPLQAVKATATCNGHLKTAGQEAEIIMFSEVPEEPTVMPVCELLKEA